MPNPTHAAHPHGLPWDESPEYMLNSQSPQRLTKARVLLPLVRWCVVSILHAQVT